MLSTFLNSSDSVVEWLRRLASDLGVVTKSKYFYVLIVIAMDIT